MTALRKKIHVLEKDINKRRALGQRQYKQAKIKLKDKLTSPTAFSIAFLLGVLIGRGKRLKKNQLEKQEEKPISKKKRNFLSPTLSALYLFTEIPRVLAYVKNFSKKDLTSSNRSDR